jgi:hypothetical protein
VSTGRSLFSSLAAWLAALGVVLAVAAGVGFIAIYDTGAGDVESIEDSLTPQAPTTAPALPAEVVDTTIAPTILESDPEPLLAANEVSRLDQLADVPSRVPIGLRIDTLGVDASVEPYGINQRTGQMDVPGNVRDVAWYEYGPTPGEAGSAVLAAHVDLKSQGPGVFFDLKSLEPGELILVTFDDGSEQWFETQARNTYQKEELPLDVIFSRDGASVLTLITCGGGFSASNQSYDSNVVVYAVPADAVPDDMDLS